MKRIFALLLTLCLVFSVATVLSSCGNKEAFNSVTLEDGAKIVIGVYEPASGDNGAGGKKETLGVKYANSIKNTVTIAGKTYPVEIEIVDNQSSNDKAVSAASALIDKNALVVLGSYGSGVSMAASDTFKEAGVPAIGITCTNPQVTEGNDHYFRACFLDPFQGTVLANYAKNELGATKAYVLACTGSDYDNGLANYFNQTFGSTTNNFPAGTNDFQGYIQNAINEKADVIFCPVSVNYAQLIIEKAHALGYTGTILGGDTLDDNMVVDAARSAGDVDVHITTFYQEGANSEFDNGFKAWLNANPTMLAENGGNDMVSAVSAMGYDTYMTALYAIEHATVSDNVITSKDVRLSLGAMTTADKAYKDGVTGVIYFDATGDCVRDTAFIKKVENGAWAFVKEQKAN